MVQLQSVIAKRLQTAGNLLQVQIQSIVDSAIHASRRAKLVFGSAFALAFLIAPAAALMMSGSPSGSLNNSDGTTSDPGTASTTDTQADAETPATPNDTDSVPSSGSSTNVNVSNNTTTVSVDGKTVVGPTTGPVSKTINTNNHQTTISVQHNGSTTTTTTTNNSVNSNSSTNISTNTYSNTESSP